MIKTKLLQIKSFTASILEKIKLLFISLYKNAEVKTFGASILVGLCAGLAAIILKTSVHAVERFVRGIVSTSDLNFLLYVFPSVGILCTVLFVRFVVKDNIGHGVTRVMEAIMYKRGDIKKHNMASSLIACTITAGSGGSVGMEAPILSTGAAIGSNFARLLKMNYRDTVMLISCGGAAAIASIFKAPIAGVLFCVEVFAIDVQARMLLPMLTASATACLLSIAASGFFIEFNFSVHEAFHIENIPLYMVLAICCAFISIYFMRVIRETESAFAKIKSWKTKIIIGGIFLAIAIFLFPSLYGEGYLSMKAMLSAKAHDLFAQSPLFLISENNFAFLAFLIVIIFLKPLATAITTGSGGVGGVFAPVLFVGCVLGFVFARSCNLTGFTNLPEINFALAGMAGLLSSTMHAPLTAVFLIAEISGGYQLLIPLMVVSTLSFAITKRFEPYSLYARPLAKKGSLISHNRDAQALSLLNIQPLIKTEVTKVLRTAKLSEYAHALAKDNTHFAIITNNDGTFASLLNASSLSSILGDQALFDTILVDDIINEKIQTISKSKSNFEIMDLFMQTNSSELAIVENKIFLGFIDKQDFLEAYRTLLKEACAD